MNPLILLKANFQNNLEKQGSSLQELESALQSMHTDEGIQKAAVLLKKAFLDKVNPIDLATKGGGTYLGLTAGLGYAGATGIENADHFIKEKNKKLHTYKEKINLLDKLTNKIKQENE